MSWILKHKKRFLILLMLLVIIGIFTAVYISLHFNYVVLVIIYLLIIVGICLNEAVRKKNLEMKKPFDTFSKIRNVDYLIIGDLCDPINFVPEGKTFVQITAPERGPRSAYQILRHTHSILREHGGTVVMPCGRNKKEFTLFDIPFLHSITIKKYQLERLKIESSLPILFAPIASIKFLWGREHYRYIATQNIDDELIKFCQERDYSLQCFIKQ